MAIPAFKKMFHKAEQNQIVGKGLCINDVAIGRGEGIKKLSNCQQIIVLKICQYGGGGMLKNKNYETNPYSLQLSQNFTIDYLLIYVFCIRCECKWECKLVFVMICRTGRTISGYTKLYKRCKSIKHRL